MAKQRGIATLIYDDTLNSWTIRSPYNKEWVQELKDLIPHGGRVWDSVAKVWKVDNFFLDELKALCTKYFEGGWDEHRPQPEVIEIEASDIYKEFIRICPWTHVEKLWKAALTDFHPDRPTGDAKKASDLNALWGKIKQDLGR